MKLFLWQFAAEWRKLLARKRTYLGFGAFIGLELVLLVIFQLDGPERFYRRIISQQGEMFEHFFSALTLAFIVLALSVFLLGGLYIALVGGDIVAKESEDGHLRMLLARPVSRLRLLFVKYLTCIGYTFLLIQFIAWTALLLGVLLRGWGGGMFAFTLETGFLGLYEWGEGIKHYAIGSLCIGASMSTVCSAAFLLSCFRIKPAAATIGALSYMLMDSILRGSGLMDSYKHLLITHYMINWTKSFIDPAPWALLARSYSVLAAVNITLFIIGAAVFHSRDIKS